MQRGRTSRFVRVVTLMLVAALFALACPRGLAFGVEKGAVEAVGTAASEAEGTRPLKVVFEAEGMPFAAYRVGAVGGDAGHPFIEPETGLAESGIDWAGATSLDELAPAVAAQLVANGAKPIAQGTVMDGAAELGSVPHGVYLVQGEPTEHAGFRWYAVPTFAIVGARATAPESPGVDMPTPEGPAGDGPAGDMVEVHPKWTREPVDEPTEERTYQIRKTWVGDDASQRPDHIEVALVHGSKVAETVVLGRENNWSYRWTAPVDGEAWSAVERDVPEGYRCAVRCEDGLVSLRNTRAEESLGPSRETATSLGGKRPGGVDELVWTGDDARGWVLAWVLAACGGAAIVGGILVRRRGRAQLFVMAGTLGLAFAGLLIVHGLAIRGGQGRTWQDAQEKLFQLVPVCREGFVTSGPGAGPAVLEVDGHDFVGYLELGGEHGGPVTIALGAPTEAYGTHLVSGDPGSGSALVAADLGQGCLEPGETLGFIDVDGIRYGYVVDHVAKAGEEVSSGLVVDLPGIAGHVRVVCLPSV